MKLKPRKVKYQVVYSTGGGIKGTLDVTIGLKSHPHLNAAVMNDIRNLIQCLPQNKYNIDKTVVIENLIRI